MVGMSRFTPSYDIGRATGRCAATGAAIQPGQPYIATLCEHADDDAFDRFDYTVEAWEGGARPERLYSYWRTTMPEPNSRKVFVDDEVLLNLFQRMEGEDQPQRIAYRFVIGLVLMRKKLIRVVSTEKRDGQSIWHIRFKGETAETPTTELVDPNLSEEQTREVADQLGEILQGEL